MSLSKHFAGLFGRSKNTIIVFAVGVAVCALLSFVSFTLCSLALSVLSVITLVLYIKVMITEHKAYYNVLKHGCPHAPARLFMNSVLCVSLVLVLTVSLLFGCGGLVLRSALSTDFSEYGLETNVPLTEEQEKLLEDSAEALAVLSEKTVERGYTSPAPYIALFIVSVISTLASVIRWHTAVTFAAKFKLHPILTIIIAIIAIDFVNQFLVSVLTSLIILAASGLSNAISEINAFLSVSGSEENSVEFLYDMADKMPYAATVIKVMVISALCTLVTAFTNALASITIINKKQ